jgi:hypothetical protein
MTADFSPSSLAIPAINLFALARLSGAMSGKA